MTTKTIKNHDVSQILNSLSKQYMGDSVIVETDLSNIVEFGKAYDGLDSGTQNMINSGMVALVTEQTFKTKDFTGSGLDLVRSRREYGNHEGIEQRNRMKPIESEDGSAVYNPEPGSTSDPFKNYPIEMETSYYANVWNELFVYSRPDRWFTGLFLEPGRAVEAMNAIEKNVANSITLHLDNYSRAALRASIAYNMNGVDLANGGPRAINLMKVFSAYNAGTTLEAERSINDPEFLRFMISEIFKYLRYMREYTTTFNDKEYPNFTADSDVSLVMLSDVQRQANAYLLSDTYNKELLELPNHTELVSWKGTKLADGDAFDFKALSTVNEKFIPSGEDQSVTVNTSGVVAHLFDINRVGIEKLSYTQTSQYDPQGLKTNFFTHVFGQTIVDPYENAITFYVA